MEWTVENSGDAYENISNLDIPKSHLLITQILRKFQEKTNELNKLRKRIDETFLELHSTDKLANKLKIGTFERKVKNLQFLKGSARAL